jgi:hypothetical protein
LHHRVTSSFRNPVMLGFRNWSARSDVDRVP